MTRAKSATPSISAARMMAAVWIVAAASGCLAIPWVMPSPMRPGHALADAADSEAGTDNRETDTDSRAQQAHVVLGGRRIHTSGRILECGEHCVQHDFPFPP